VFQDGNGNYLILGGGSAMGALPKLAFMNAPQIEQPTITGSRGGNAALENLLIALQNYGLIVDSTT
jgi:hypothetical protein